ncbi:STAS domain-containing protein [Streptomyces sp. NPDC101209]|uniref:STAS domain-containing protein n=1 Tax=Streptomyces sp. NPDC101209 TaxID=3366129 RepID=UPI0037F60DFB
MPSRSPVVIVPSTNRATVVSVAGALDAEACSRFERELWQHLDEAARQGQRLVLDLAGVSMVSAAARRTLQQLTDHLIEHPVCVVGAPAAVRMVLEQAELAGVRVYDTLADALAALPPAHDIALGLSTWQHGHEAFHTGDTQNTEVEAEAWRGEVFGLRAKGRTAGLIGIAQGVLMARYDLPSAESAFTLLREGSQHFNVPLRVLASALVTAPPPRSAEVWFPGRSRHSTPPGAAFLRRHRVSVTDRHHVLTAVLYEAVTVSDADAAAVHFIDPAQDGALFLEQHHGLDAAYWDTVALVTGPPHVCARAQQCGEAVRVPDVAQDRALADHPVGRHLLEVGSRAVHSVPMIAADGHCTGTLTLYWAKPGSWLTEGQQVALSVLATEVAAWRSWYRRTIVLDALEYLHHYAGKDSSRE